MNEARKVAVLWIEGYETMGFDIRQKHKLASDLMNYAASKTKEKDQEIANLKAELSEKDIIIEHQKGRIDHFSEGWEFYEATQKQLMQQSVELNNLKTDLQRVTEERDGLLRKCEELNEFIEAFKKLVELTKPVPKPVEFIDDTSKI